VEREKEREVCKYGRIMLTEMTKKEKKKINLREAREQNRRKRVGNWNITL